MKKIITFVLTLLGMGASTACSQQAFENKNVDGFEKFVADSRVQLLDVRTAEEYAEGHLDQALNIDVNQSSFLTDATARLDKNRPVAVYCRSGKRSTRAAGMLAEQGYQVVNLVGGIIAWKADGKPVTTAQYEVDEFATPGGQVVRFHALLHASIRLDIGDRHVYIDPVCKLGNRAVDYSAMPKADYILVTHEHGDHFDPSAIRLLTGDSTRLVTNRRCADLLKSTPSSWEDNSRSELPSSWEEGAGVVEVMQNGERLTLADDLSLEAVPAYNITEGHLQFHPKGRDNGFVITLDGLRIYVAGDTEDIPEMANLAPASEGDGQKAIDVAFLPCNQPYTMTPDQLLHAARIIQPRVLFPYHFGQTDVSGIPAQLQDLPIDVRLRHYE